MDDSLVKHVTWDTKCLSGWVPDGKGLLYNKSDMVENYLHGLIDQFCDVQPDKGMGMI